MRNSWLALATKSTRIRSTRLRLGEIAQRQQRRADFAGLGGKRRHADVEQAFDRDPFAPQDGFRRAARHDPAQGVDFGRGRAGRGSRERRWRCAGAARPNARAGPADMRSSSVSSASIPGSTSAVERGERRLEPGDAEGRLLERHSFSSARAARGRSRRARSCRRVAPRSAPPVVARRAAAGSSSRRVERADRLVGEAEVVRRHLAGRLRRRPPRARRSWSTDSSPRGA